jgi:hypothetical protein
MQICFWRLNEFTSGIFASLEQKAAEIENLSWDQASRSKPSFERCIISRFPKSDSFKLKEGLEKVYSILFFPLLSNATQNTS